MDDLAGLRSFVQAKLGIKMPPSKAPMLQSRLQVRLRKLGLKSFTEYHEFILQSSDREQELVTLIDAVTTNKTEFYRESGHFEFLVTRVLPELDSPRGGRFWKAWCAGCSSGEEAYTLAMLLADYGTSPRSSASKSLVDGIKMKSPGVCRVADAQHRTPRSFSSERSTSLAAE